MNFQYKVRDSAGKIISATKEASSREAVIKDLRQKGLQPIVVIPEKKSASKISQQKQAWYQLSWGKIAKEEEIFVFTRDLLTLVHSGVPIITGLRDIVSQVQNERFREILREIYLDVDAGSKLSEAFAKYPQVFSEFYQKSLLAGEKSGRLEQILNRLIETLDHDIETRNTIQNAIRYPVMVLGALILAFVLVLTFAVPNIANLFTQFNTPLPLPTRFLIGLGAFSKKYGALVLIGCGIFSFLFSIYKKTPSGRFVWDFVKLRAPVFGILFKKLALSRFAATLQILHASGIVLPEGLNITSRVVDNEVIAKAILRAQQGVNAGKSLYEGLHETGIFTPLVLRMVMMGEKSGNLEEMLGEIVHHYDREVKYTTKALGTMIEPILTVLLGGMVLIFALGIFLPMWNVLKLIRQ